MATTTREPATAAQASHQKALVKLRPRGLRLLGGVDLVCGGDVWAGAWAVAVEAAGSGAREEGEQDRGADERDESDQQPPSRVVGVVQATDSGQQHHGHAHHRDDSADGGTRHGIARQPEARVNAVSDKRHEPTRQPEHPVLASQSTTCCLHTSHPPDHFRRKHWKYFTPVRRPTRPGGFPLLRRAR